MRAAVDWAVGVIDPGLAGQVAQRVVGVGFVVGGWHQLDVTTNQACYCILREQFFLQNSPRLCIY